MSGSPERAPITVVPSRYGPDDQIGAANEITPDVVRAAAALITTGKRYSLGQVLESDSPAQMWRYWKQSLLVDRVLPERSFGSNQQTFLEESASGAIHSGTHLDGLAHVGIGEYAYNGHRYADIISPSGVTKLGAENIPPLFTRGLLLDIAALHGVAQLGPEQPITAADLAAAESAAGVHVGGGDIVILNTGWGTQWKSDPDRYSMTEPGLTPDAATWLAERRVAVIGADNWAVELVTMTPGDLAFPVHQECITRNGIYLLENVRTEELVADGVVEFCCVIAPTRLFGASGSMVGPIAIT
jgi:kynurenine formamidase